ncbi:hypothetical protein GCM10011515_05580 [Tsuneonella deserti]|uniref:Lipoprotein n=1 Tax=Tsuneonella deserti TaxID=2035528 RepID=A0ABQ1S2Q6_9SPHN|nr:hypothetical protein [Tsuneonella deserti]GGD88794.1 hypothetical protein GCM10011515_05580 [Tsuneonella deserti]
MVRVASTVLLLAAMLAGCGKETAPAAIEPQDPAIAQALGDPLMTDPDLSTRNEGAAALTVVTDGGLPVVPTSADAVAAARAEAAVLIGSADKHGEIPRPSGKVEPLPPGHTPGDHLALLEDKTACRARLDGSTIWAARLPAALPVYPRGATIAATGGEGNGCRVVAVVFTTPVPGEEVLAFYWQRAKAAGFKPERRVAGDSAVLQGNRAGAAFDLRLSETAGETRVELATVTG